MSSTPSYIEKIDRRKFIVTTAIAGAGLALAQSSIAQTVTTGAKTRRRYALVGTGSRSSMFREAVLKTYAQYCEMVGYCDLNPGRLKLAQTNAREAAGVEVPIFEA